ncbi:MAG: sulfite oxidase heme-binding subunit YedZ [Myxococcaceae bacterium]
MASKKLPWLKPALLTAFAIPIASLAWRAYRGQLGANPVSEALNSLGLLALVTLIASLACTPLNQIFKWGWPARIRRMLGVTAFIYASLHLLLYAVVDQQLNWKVLWEDVTTRKFILVGFLAFVLMTPLAVTSTDAMVKRLGFVKWKRLHRVAYVCGVLGVIHFIWRVKSDLSEPLMYGAVLAALLLLRPKPRFKNRQSVGLQ